MKILLVIAVTLAPSLAQATCTDGRMSNVYDTVTAMADGPYKMAVNRKLGLANNAYALGTIRECDFHLAEAIRIQGLGAQLESRGNQAPDYSLLLKNSIFGPALSEPNSANPEVPRGKPNVDRRPRIDAICGDQDCNVPVTETRYSQPGGGGRNTDRPAK
ncbi:hypothetical protein BH10PSE11_BH10PSE11_04080 [soil metagenome]